MCGQTSSSGAANFTELYKESVLPLWKTNVSSGFSLLFCLAKEEYKLRRIKCYVCNPLLISDRFKDK
jgi:hypothetical protein